jgi:large subunit ribosomal protein L30e
MDLVKEIKKAISTGKVYFGIEQAKKAIKKGEAKILIVAKNCPDKNFLGETLENVKIVHFDGTASDLGSVCGKMFDISVVTVVDPGESSIIKEQ